MIDIRRLERTLAENVSWNKARINFLAKFTLALVQVKIVSLVLIAEVLNGRNRTRITNDVNESCASLTCRLPR
jgi:hypothetical protein